MLATLALTTLLGAQSDRPGFDDTPFLPGGKWRVHDKMRPYPEVKEPKPWNEEPIAALPGAVQVEWTNKNWVTESGVLRAKNGTNSSKQALGNGMYHVEWRVPVDQNKGQDSGNSGVFLLGQYEIQILNSYENVTYADGQAASLYGQMPPKFNVCRPQGKWQTFDIEFVGPVFAKDGNLKSAGKITLFHNGVKVLDRVKVLGSTAYRSLAKYKAHPPKAPMTLQDHGSPVEFRNIWHVPAK